MKKNNILDSLNSLKEKDIYSTLLYCLYKLNKSEKYSTISSLMWALDKDSLLNLLTLFGGVEMKIPTIYDMRVVAYSLLLYQFLDLNKDCESIEDAVAKVNILDVSKEDVVSAYLELRDIINKEGLPHV